MLDAIAEESYEDGDKIVWGTYQVTFHRISGNLELSDVYSGEIKTTVDVGEDFDTVTSILTDAIKNDVTPTPTPAVNESLGVPAPSGTMNVFSTWENDSETFAYDFAGFENDVSDGNTGPNDYFDAGDGYHVTNDSANGMWALWNITLDPDDPIAKYPQDGNAAASIQSAIKLQEVSGSAPLPITYDSNVELAKINDIPKNIGGVLELFGGQMTAGQAKQYRNAGYALDDAKDYAVDSPTWNQAVNKAIYNLTQSGPAGQLKLNQVNKWRTDTLNAHNGGVIESDTPVSDAVLPSGYATPPVDAKAIYTNASVAAESNSSISYAVVDADGKVAYYKSDGAVHPMNRMTEEVLKNHPGWVPYNGTEVSESTSQTSGPDLSQPHKMDMNNNPMFIGDKVFWTTKGIEVTVHKFENNDVGVIVTSVDANGNKKKHALNRKKLKLISSPSQAHSQAQNKSGPPPVNQYSAVTSATVEPDPSSPWFGKPQPEKPELDLIADPSSKKLVNDEWMKTANENYKKGAKAENPNWIEKELESSLTYGEYKAVQQGNTNSLNNLFTKGWITPDMHADALMQIAENNEAYELALEKNNEKLAAWRKDVKAWRDANGLPSITLKGMDDGVLKFDNHGAITWMNAHQKPGSLTPTGKLTGQSYNAVANQKSSNISSQLRAGKEKTLDPEWVAQNGGYSTLGLDQAMLDSPPLEQDFMVTRTLDMDNFINPATGSPYDYTDILSNSAGSIQHDWGFAETSVGSYDAGATVGYGSGRKIRMQLRVPKGTRGVWTNHPDQNFGYESERGFLLERGIAYYIHSVEWKNGHWAVNAEVIPKDVNYDQFGHFINENPFFN